MIAGQWRSFRKARSKSMKRLAVRFRAAKRFKPSCNFCTSFLSSLFVPAFPSYPLAVLSQAILGIEQPIAPLARGTPSQ
jgi:hypothetical protein